MRKGKLCFILLFLVLFYWPNLALSHSDLFPTDSIPSIPDLVLEQRRDKADVFFPDVTAISKRFPVVAVLQGAGVDKSFYTEFGTQLPRYGFVVVIPNHFQMPFFPPGAPPSPLPDQFVVLDVLDQMELEDADPASPLFGIVDTGRLGLVGHSFGGATGLFVIDGRCDGPPFCDEAMFGPFERPEELVAGAFYGTNTCSAGGTVKVSGCIDFNSIPPNPGLLLDVVTDDYMVDACPRPLGQCNRSPRAPKARGMPDVSSAVYLSKDPDENSAVKISRQVAFGKSKIGWRETYNSPCHL